MVRVTHRRGRYYFYSGDTRSGEPIARRDPRSGLAPEPLPASVEGGRMNIFAFTYGGLLTTDEFADDIEVAPEEYRANYELRQDDQVVVTLIERNDARPGKPAYWVTDRIGTVAHADLERLIQRCVDREQVRVRHLAEEDAA
jgi:hypothetical protein